MSEEEGSTLTGVVTTIMGGIILILGLIVVYFSLITGPSLVDPRIITPLGLAVVLIGAFMILARKTS